MGESRSGTAGSFVLGALGLLACAPPAQEPVHVPIAEFAGDYPASVQVEVTSSEQEEEASNLALLDQFDLRARANIRFAFSARLHRYDACFDSSDTEVACSNARAVRQATRFWDEIASSIANRSGAPLTCEATGSTCVTAVVPQKETRTFSIRTMTRAVDAEREAVSVRCTRPAAGAHASGASPDTGERAVGVEVRYSGNAQIITRTIGE